MAGKTANTGHKDGIAVMTLAVIDGNENTSEKGIWTAGRPEAHRQFPDAFRGPRENRLPIDKLTNGPLWKETHVVPGQVYPATLMGQVAIDYELTALQDLVEDWVYAERRYKSERQVNRHCTGMTCNPNQTALAADERYDPDPAGWRGQSKNKKYEKTVA